MIISPVSKQRKKKNKKKTPSTNQKTHIHYVCLSCGAKEKIPYAVVRDFDRMDAGDPTVPPMFSCESCGGQMYPESYKGIHGVEYSISDIR